MVARDVEACDTQLSSAELRGEVQRIVAARPDYWTENAIHLPQMIAVRLLAWREWHEQLGMRQEGSTIDLAFPYLRPAILLWLAALPEGHALTEHPEEPRVYDASTTDPFIAAVRVGQNQPRVVRLVIDQPSNQADIRTD